MAKYDYLIVGAGFSGAVLAERLASQLDKKILIIDKRKHIAGNAFDEYDKFGVLVHRFGPHIFHTNSDKVFNYLSEFTEWHEYEHKVLADLNGRLFPIPLNRISINMLYDLKLSTEEETGFFFDSVKEKRYPVLNSEDVIVNKIGLDLFNKFFKHYTLKQWNLEPKELSPEVCGRIPARLNDDCRYFQDKYQVMPTQGYNVLFNNMLNHPNIELILATDYKTIESNTDFDKMIYTGPVDYFFDYMHGSLPYRSIKFQFENYEKEFFQETAQINYVTPDVEFTRVVEFKHMTGQKINCTIRHRI